MTVEQLMKPRYKVINNWPDMDKWNVKQGKTFVGQVIKMTHKEKGQWYVSVLIGRVYDAFFDGYPHLFEKLPWYAERSVEEMPEYVKWTKKYDADPVREYGDVMKVTQWHSNTHFTSERQGWKLTGGWFEPATLADYTQYINQTK